MTKVVQLGSRIGGGLSSKTVTTSVLDARAEMWKRLARVGQTRMVLGFPKYERIVLPTAYQYAILAARPGMFKSTLAWIWAVNLALSGKRVLWLGIEMSHDVMFLWALSRLTEVPVREIESHGRGLTSLQSSALQRLTETQEKLETLPLVLWAERTATLQQVSEAMLRAPYDAVFLDYLGLVQTVAGAQDYDRMNAISSELRKLTSEHPVHVVALAQMNREIERHSGKPRVPNLSDLKGSGQLEADADVVAFLHRSEVGPTAPRDRVQLRVEKNRNGPTGVVELVVRPEWKDVYEQADAVPQDLPGTEDRS